MSEKIEKSVDDSQNNESSANTSLELTEEDKGLFRKFIDFVKGEDNSMVSDEAEGDALNKNEEGETSEMDKEELTKAINEAVAGVNESAEEKFGQVAESLVKITEALEKVATAEAVDAIKTDFEAKLTALEERLATVETSGAVRKSGDDSTDESKIEKSEEGFWAGALLPEFALQKG